MSKELEALERIKSKIIIETEVKVNKELGFVNPYYNDYLTIKQALQRLELIDNANPSEALEKFDYIGNDINFAYDDDYISYDYTDDVEYIKQALLKAQEQEKVLNIIKEKNVDIQYLKRCKNAKQYNKSALLYEELSNEEFDLLKEVFKNE